LEPGPRVRDRSRLPGNSEGAPPIGTWVCVIPLRGPRHLKRGGGIAGSAVELPRAGDSFASRKFEEMLEGAGPAMAELHSSRGCAFVGGSTR
jgi:hypothetical protein